jgi:hypothetical protein
MVRGEHEREREREKTVGVKMCHKHRKLDDVANVSINFYASLTHSLLYTPYVYSKIPRTEIHSYINPCPRQRRESSISRGKYIKRAWGFKGKEGGKRLLRMYVSVACLENDENVVFLPRDGAQISSLPSPPPDHTTSAAAVAKAEMFLNALSSLHSRTFLLRTIFGIPFKYIKRASRQSEDSFSVFLK